MLHLDLWRVIASWLPARDLGRLRRARTGFAGIPFGLQHYRGLLPKDLHSSHICGRVLKHEICGKARTTFDLTMEPAILCKIPSRGKKYGGVYVHYGVYLDHYDPVALRLAAAHAFGFECNCGDACCPCEPVCDCRLYYKTGRICLSDMIYVDQHIQLDNGEIIHEYTITQ